MPDNVFNYKNTYYTRITEYFEQTSKWPPYLRFNIYIESVYFVGRFWRVRVELCFELGKNASETYAMIDIAIVDDPLSGSVTFEWFQGPSTSRIDNVSATICANVRNDRLRTVRELANDAGISIGRCHEIFIENLRTRSLTLEQEGNRLTLCRNVENRSAEVFRGYIYISFR